MTSLALSLVQQANYRRPKNPANNRAAEPSKNLQDWSTKNGTDDFSEVSLLEFWQISL